MTSQSPALADLYTAEQASLRVFVVDDTEVNHRSWCVLVEGAVTRGHGFFENPYAAEQLLATVREVLGQ